MSTEFFNDQWRIPSNENQNKISNYSMDFDGTSAEIDLGISPVDLVGNSKPYSVSAWVYIAQSDLVSGTNYFIIGAFNPDRWYFRIMNSYVGFGYGNTVSNTSLTQITGDQWNHIVFTFDLTTHTIYINGVSKFTLSSSGQTIASNNAFIGALNGSSGPINRFKGKLDQVSIFNYALSQDQVTQLGAEGYAFDFDGVSNQKISVGSSAVVNLGIVFTFSAWIKPNSWTGYDAVYSGGPSSSGYIGSGGGLFVLRASGQGNAREYALPSTGSWTHICLVRTALTTTGIKMYYNGVEQTALASDETYNISFNSSTYYIGNDQNNGADFNGQVSNTAIWDTELTSTQITTLYNNGRPGDISSLNPEGWWKLDDTATFNSGTSVWSIPDASTNSNTGASVGMDASNLVASNIDGELISNPMSLNPKPIYFAQLGDQSVDNGANYLVPNNSLSDYVFDFIPTDKIEINSNVGNFDRTDSFSFSWWMNMDNPSVTNQTPISKQDVSDSFRGYNIYNNSAGQLQFIFGISSGYLWLRTTSSIPAGQWLHVSITYDGSSDWTGVNIYFNGVPETTILQANGLTSGTTLNSAPFQISGRGGGNGTFNGLLSNLSIFNTELTSTQVETIYNNGSPNDISSLNPVSWYKLNASEIFNNTSTEWSVDNNAYPSVYNSSLDFDGSSDSVDCGNGSSLDITGALSISFWIYGETNLAHKGIVSKCPSSGSIPTVAQYHIQYQTNNTLRFVLRNFDLYTGKETTGTVPTVDLNTWQHITMTWNGTNTMTVYKNGLPVCTKVQAITNVSNTSPVLLGERAVGGFLNGKLSNTAIWNTELNSTQITTLYNNGTPASDISSLSPVSWWKLDNTTTGLLDSGSASNNGTNNGAAEYAGFVNALAGESSGMDSSNLVVSDLQQTSGYSPYALDFSSIPAYLKTYTTPAATNTVTLSAWVKRTGASGSYAGVFGVRNSGGSPNFGICWDLCFLSTTNKIEFRVSETDGSAYIQSTSNVALSDNTWTHVVGVADGTNVKLYINGVLQTDVESYNGTLRAPTSNILFAGQGPGGSPPFSGQLSNCARWNIGLTQAEVTEIYNQGVPSNLNTFSGTAPIGWWQIGSNSSFEGDDWTCLDEIGTDYADSGTTAMSNDDIVDGPGYSASGLGTSSIDIKGDAPYSTANGLSENMDVLDRVSGTGNVPG